MPGAVSETDIGNPKDQFSEVTKLRPKGGSTLERVLSVKGTP